MAESRDCSRASTRAVAFVLIGVFTGCAQPPVVDDDEGRIPNPIYTYPKQDGGESEDADPEVDAAEEEEQGDGDADAPIGQDDSGTPDGGDAGTPDGEDAAPPDGEDAAPPDGADASTPDSGGAPVGCLEPKTMCGSACVDLKTSSQHCGACGHKCPGNAACDGTGRCTAPANCRYDLRNGHDYLFCSTQRSFSQARESCIGFGLDLVIVADQAENDFIKGSASQWIGLTDIRKEGEFRWVVPGNSSNLEGAVATYKPWTQGEPNNAVACIFPFFGCTNENCAEVTPSGTWNDAQCDKASRAYVCESY